MFTFQQSTGQLTKDGVAFGSGYSGMGEGVDNPADQYVPNVGPIPQGKYTIGAPIDLTGGPHGPFVLPLTPDKSDVLEGRSGFLIHGDNTHANHTASKGCIIMPYAVRLRISKSGDNQLTVIE